MQDQGVGVTRTKKGLLLRLPDKTTTTVHFTNSDVRAHDNMIARLRRSGVRHPDDPKDVAELPSQITTERASAASQRKAREAVATLGYPEVVTVKAIREASGMEHITTSKALYTLGFKPVRGKRNERNWLTPQEILDQKPAEEEVPEPESPTFEEESVLLHDGTVPEDIVNEVREAFTVIDVHPPQDAEVTRAPEREFLDTHDSWVVVSGFPQPVLDYMEILRGAGLGVEIRVWRA